VNEHATRAADVSPFVITAIPGEPVPAEPDLDALAEFYERFYAHVGHPHKTGDADATCGNAAPVPASNLGGGHGPVQHVAR
jgi:hypothetical protein